MKVIIAGGRDIEFAEPVIDAIKLSGFDVTEVVSGGARGVDTIGETLAAQHGIPIRRFPADWYTFGKAAGPMRNRQMAKYAEALIAVWDGISKGTKNMIEVARKAGLEVYVHKVGVGEYVRNRERKTDGPESRLRIRLNGLRRRRRVQTGG